MPHLADSVSKSLVLPGASPERRSENPGAAENSIWGGALFSLLKLPEVLCSRHEENDRPVDVNKMINRIQVEILKRLSPTWIVETVRSIISWVGAAVRSHIAEHIAAAISQSSKNIFDDISGHLSGKRGGAKRRGTADRENI